MNQFISFVYWDILSEESGTDSLEPLVTKLIL